jgi:hypothetical protein
MNHFCSGWWLTYLSEKWWSSSVGMMTFPTEWKVRFSHVPNHQPGSFIDDLLMICNIYPIYMFIPKPPIKIIHFISADPITRASTRPLCLRSSRARRRLTYTTPTHRYVQCMYNAYTFYCSWIWKNSCIYDMYIYISI